MVHGDFPKALLLPCKERINLAVIIALHSGAQQPCNADSFAQTQRFTGSWVNSPNDSFNGFYTMTTDCPTWARDYDCKNPQLGGKRLLLCTSCQNNQKVDTLP